MLIKKQMAEQGVPYFSAPLIVNIQLSNYCPLSCPLCFMSFNEKKDMDMQQLEKYLWELSALGCRSINFGQGEPMVSNLVAPAVALASKLGFRIVIATSGAGCNYNKLQRLYDLGLTELHVSLNSFDEKTNSLTRDGYKLAIYAIQLATSIGIKTKLTYVAQDLTIPEFSQYIQIAKEMKVEGISVLREKVNHDGQIHAYSAETLRTLANQIKQSCLPIEIEECFCELKLLLSTNKPSMLQGCAAGRAMMAITSKGDFLPCSHLASKAERYLSIADYWSNSSILNRLRNLTLNGAPCCECIYVSHCTSCQALYPDCRDEFHAGRIGCSLYKRKI